MIRKTSMTSRPLEEDERDTLTFLQTLHPNWIFIGIIGSLKLFRLSVVD